MGQKHPKFVEPYQLTSSNFDNLGSIQFDGYDPTFPLVTLGQEFSTTSNVDFLNDNFRIISFFIRFSTPVYIFRDGIGTKLPVKWGTFNR